MKPRQTGTVLFICLVILIGATVLSLAAVNTSVMSLRMAGNEESGANTFQTALAAIDFIISDTENNLPTSGPLNDPQPVSFEKEAVLFESTTGEAVRVEDCAAPPRARLGSSINAFSAFRYEIDVDVARNASGQGRAEMTQGYTLLGPKC